MSNSIVNGDDNYTVAGKAIGFALEQTLRDAAIYFETSNGCGITPPVPLGYSCNHYKRFFVSPQPSGNRRQ
jgi:hypothetical protein